MMQASPNHDPVVALATYLRSEHGAVLAAWRARVVALPTSEEPSLAGHGDRLLTWLATCLESEARTFGGSSALLRDESFSAPRAIAELTLLTDTIGQLRPASAGAARECMHRVVDAAVAQSLARDADENERLRKRLRLATEVTLVGSWELDPATGAIGADARSRELFGILEGEPATLEALTARLHEGDRERIRGGIAGTLASGRPFLDDCRTLPGEAGQRWIAIAADAHQVPGASSPRVLAIVHDITDRKRLEEEHARLVEELSRAVHISEMFIGILGHDLRNPLSAILAGAHMLRADLHDERAGRVLSRVVSSGERMGRMIDQLLDFTRARLGEGIPLARAKVDLAQLAREAVEEGRLASPASVLRVSALGDTSGAWDRDRLCQILSNLVGNAIQHGEPGGAIDVVLDGTDLQQVVLSVENQGVIPAHLLPVIFNPFRGTFQRRGKSTGLGLGLYVARQIAIAHGGELQAESTTGTVFELVLPRAAPAGLTTKQDFVREEELAAFERMAAPASTTAITAQLFGATPLHERAPREYGDIAEGYGQMLQKALDRRAYRGQGEGLAGDLRALADRLGDLGAGPREVTEVHARALRSAVRGVTAARSQALLSEGRLLALELMGNLASYYRRRSRGQARPAADGRTQT